MDFDSFFDEAMKNLPEDDGQSRAYFDDTLRDLPYRQDGREVGSLAWDSNSRIIPISDAGDDEKWGPCSTEERDLIDGASRKIGFEILAFYKSRRHRDEKPYPGTWGIYYLRQGLSRIENHLEAATRYAPPISSDMALEFLRKHEQFHYKFDVWALSIESASKRNLYLPLKRAFRHCPDLQVEEALANQDAFRWARPPSRGLKTFARDLMDVQPRYYTRYGEPRVKLLAELSVSLVDQLIGGPPRYDQTLWNGNIGLLKPRKLVHPPEHLIVECDLGALIPSHWTWPKITHIEESKKFVKSLKRFHQLKQKWEATKVKLFREPGMNGLDFKEWEARCFSVRVDKNFRAHLKPRNDFSGFGKH